MKNLLETYELMYYFLFGHSKRAFASFIWIIISLNGSTALAQSLEYGLITTLLASATLFIALTLLPLWLLKLVKK